MNQPLAIGTVLEVQDMHRDVSQFVVAGYDERDFMKMTKKNDASIFMTLHPAHALRIAQNGGESGIKVLNAVSLNDVIVKATEAIVDVPKPIVTVESNKAKREGKSKKERALEIKAANPNATRKELIAMFMEQLDMTAAGASTYASMK